MWRSLKSNSGIDTSTVCFSVYVSIAFEEDDLILNEASTIFFQQELIHLLELFFIVLFIFWYLYTIILIHYF